MNSYFCKNCNHHISKYKQIWLHKKTTGFYTGRNKSCRELQCECEVAELNIKR